MKKLILRSFIAFLIFSFTFLISNAQVIIPDANFKNALVINSSINTNLDAEIQVSEATAFTGTINVSNLSIADLTGIEAFTALTSLDCSVNFLPSLNVSANTALTSLYCYNNQLISLDVSANTALANLECWNNQLTSLDVSANTELTNLACGSNQLTSLNLSSNTALTFLNCNNNNLTCLNVKNGFNSNVTNFFAANNPGLSCIQVDNVNYSNTFWTNIDATAGFSADCEPDIHGNVSYSGGFVTNGVAIIYPHYPYYTSFDTLQIDTLDLSGNYHFTNICQGNYLIKIFPDTFNYPTLAPTYFDNDWAWDSAAVISHGYIFNDTASVTMVEMTGTGGGIGLLHGIIVEGGGFGRAVGDPVHGVDVKLGITGSSTIVASTETDTITGEYTFTNVTFGNYTIYVDIPGLARDSSYEITVDAANNQILNLNYIVDSVAIYVLPNIGIENISATDNKFNVYPNPVIGNSTIAYSIISDAYIKLDVYNVVGAKVQSIVNAQQESGEYQLNFNPQNSNLKPGVYFISLSVDGKTSTMRIVVME